MYDREQRTRCSRPETSIRHPGAVACVHEGVLVPHALLAVRETYPDDGSGDALVGRLEGLHIPTAAERNT